MNPSKRARNSIATITSPNAIARRLRTACAARLLPLLLLLALPAAVQAQFTFTTNADNTITITGCIVTSGAVTIPDTITGMPVTGIGSGAFSMHSGLTGVVIGASVAILYAPKSGKETRQFISDKTQQGKDAVAETGKDVVEASKEMFERGRKLVEDAADLFDRGRKLVGG